MRKTIARLIEVQRGRKVWKEVAILRKKKNINFVKKKKKKKKKNARTSSK